MFATLSAQHMTELQGYTSPCLQCSVSSIEQHALSNIQCVPAKQLTSVLHSFLLIQCVPARQLTSVLHGLEALQVGIAEIVSAYSHAWHKAAEIATWAGSIDWHHDQAAQYSRLTSVSHAKHRPVYLVNSRLTTLLASDGVSTTQMSAGTSGVKDAAAVSSASSELSGLPMSCGE